jgi:LAO/AO transport system kinase
MSTAREPLDRLALGRALTRLAQVGADAAVPAPPVGATPARRIGVTGPPGAGKSTLTGHLALHRLPGHRIGVLAVDPSSPRSGGAILGDRIRMDELEGSTELYIRSLSSRTSTDGLSDNLPEMLDLMDAHGFDEVLLETVGVGQAEYAVRMQVDTLLLVVLPESGDVVQAMKAGIMEMADIIVVNKADLPGAQRMAADIQRIVAMSRRDPDAWRPPVLLTAASQPVTIAALSSAIDQHQAWLARTGGQTQQRVLRARYRLRRLVERRVAEVVAGLETDVLARPMHEQVEHVAREIARPSDG